MKPDELIDVLIVSYAYPRPGTGWGGAVGGERMRQFVRYLPRHGFRPTLLTHHGDASGALSPELHAARDIVRSVVEHRLKRPRASGPREGWRVNRLRERARRLTLPDRATYTWGPFALAEGLKLGRERRPALVLSSSPPMAAHAVAAALASTWLVPWIVDVRDGYSFEPPEGRGPLLRARRMLEHALYERADRIITVTDPLRDDLQALLPARADDIVTIENGYDDDLFAEATPTADVRAFEILYTGSISRVGCRLRPVCVAAERLASRYPHPVTLKLVGLFADEDVGLPLKHARVERTGWQERAQVALAMRRASVLVVLTGNQESVATTKLFEYIGAGRPILVVGRRSAAARLVTEHGFGVAADDNADDIARALSAIADERDGWERRLHAAGMLEKRRSFSRSAQAARLAALLHEVLSKRER